MSEKLTKVSKTNISCHLRIKSFGRHISCEIKQPEFRSQQNASVPNHHPVPYPGTMTSSQKDKFIPPKHLYKYIYMNINININIENI